MRKGKKILAVLLLAAMVLSALSACGAEKRQTNSQTETSSRESQHRPHTEDHVDTMDFIHTHDRPEHEKKDKYQEVKTGLQSFSAELFKTQYSMTENKSDNVFLSPFSVYAALSMLQNGASGDTQQEMEDVLGCNTKIEKDFFKKYLRRLKETDNSSLSIANSLWINDESSAKVNERFVHNVQKSYNAEVFRDKANDETVNKINQWASDNTKGMVPSILSPEALNASTVTVLLNAVCFDEQWLDQYTEKDVSDMTFNNYDGSTKEIPFMRSTEHSYIKDEKAEGFIKYYDNGNNEPRYAFVALLPEEGMNIDDYVSEYFKADTISGLVKNVNSEKVHAALPKFKFDTKYEMPAVLKAMGLNLMFDGEKADLTEMAKLENGNISVNKVVHKAHIEVDEHGTKAAAVTAIDTVANGIAAPEQSHDVILDRPFMFAIYDCQENVVLFTGVYKTAE